MSTLSALLTTKSLTTFLFLIYSLTTNAQINIINNIGTSGKLIYNYSVRNSGLDTTDIHPEYWIIPEFHLEKRVGVRTYLTFSAGAWGYEVSQESMRDDSKEVVHKLIQKRKLNLSFSLGLDYALLRDHAGLPVIAFNLNAGYLSTQGPNIKEHFIFKDDFFARELSYDFDSGHGFDTQAGLDLRIKIKRISIRGSVFYSYTRFSQKYSISSEDGYNAKGNLQSSTEGAGIALGVFYRIN
jgi:hypothetical protein